MVVVRWVGGGCDVGVAVGRYLTMVHITSFSYMIHYTLYIIHDTYDTLPYMIFHVIIILYDYKFIPPLYILYYFILFYTILYYFILFYTVLYYFMWVEVAFVGQSRICGSKWNVWVKVE